MNSKEITVLLPINVPNSEWCININFHSWCQYYEDGCCKLGFTPEADGYNYRKPNACKKLIWQENIIEHKILDKNILV